jgi:sigma-B regulation protein RsbU (phosphoserine phosphatase)
VVLFTDGVLEARRGTELYGQDRLSAALAARRLESAEAVAKGLLDDVLAFQAGTRATTS